MLLVKQDESCICLGCLWSIKWVLKSETNLEIVSEQIPLNMVWAPPAGELLWSGVALKRLDPKPTKLVERGSYIEVSRVWVRFEVERNNVGNCREIRLLQCVYRRGGGGAWYMHSSYLSSRLCLCLWIDKAMQETRPQQSFPLESLKFLGREEQYSLVIESIFLSNHLDIFRGVNGRIEGECGN